MPGRSADSHLCTERPTFGALRHHRTRFEHILSCVWRRHADVMRMQHCSRPGGFSEPMHIILMHIAAHMCECVCVCISMRCSGAAVTWTSFRASFSLSHGPLLGRAFIIMYSDTSANNVSIAGCFFGGYVGLWQVIVQTQLHYSVDCSAFDYFNTHQH